MILKFSIVLLLSCTFFAANVVGKDRKKGSSQREEAEEQSQDQYGSQNGYSQSGQYYDNGQVNPNQQYDPYEQTNNGYGQNTHKRPGQKPISIGNGRGNTNVVAINGNDEPYIVGYSSPGGAFEYDQYGNRRDIPSHSIGKGTGNNVIVVKERGRHPDTVVLSSQSKNGQKSTIIVNENGVNLNPGASRNPYNSRGSYQSQDYGYY